MNLDKINYDFETGPEARNIAGRELEYFVYLLWKGSPDVIYKYARKLRSKGIPSSTLTLVAAESYFPFANEHEEQPIRAKKIVKRFANSPYYWETSFPRAQDIKAMERK